MKKSTLFLCTGNSCRSQMAEAFLRYLAGDRFDICSAGLDPTNVHQCAVKAMKEIGIDISNQRAKSVQEFLGKQFDYVVTVCDNAKQECPVFPGKYKQIHWNLADPAKVQGTDEEVMKMFRNTRDIIKQNINNFIAENVVQSD